ncbi:MAG: PAS domain S-box protein [Theionarchaea archaeon]|nr:PAS domain S-box protein [Theionarchaea archaeon]
MKVLVMKKESETLNRVKSILEEAGYEIVTLKGAGQALEILQKTYTDGVISDTFLPEKDGLEICKRIKCDKILQGIHFVFWTESMSSEERNLALDSGADLVLGDEDPETIGLKIRNALENPEKKKEEVAAGDFWKKYSLLLKKKLDEMSERSRSFQRRLSESEKRYRILFEGSHDATFISDTHGVHLVANKKAADLLGYSMEEFRELSFRDIIASSAIPDSEEKMRRILQGEDVPVQEKDFKTKDGIIIPVEVSASAIRDEKGNVAYVQSVVRDMREKRKIEEALKRSERQYRDLFENAPIGIYRTTPDGRILMSNPTLVHLLGYTTFQELTARNLEEEGFEAGYPRSVFKEFLERDGQIVGLESAWTRKDGSVVFLRENAKAIRDEGGTVLYYEGTVEDITDRKEAEERLREYSARLEREVAERTRELRDAQEELIRKGKLAVLGQLAGNVGHELRNPLGVIGNSAYFLRMKLEDADDMTRKHLGIIEMNVERATMIIEELLGFSRTRKPQLVHVNINTLLRDALSSVRVPDSVQVVYSVDETVPRALLDSEQIRRVFINLITNAVQAMPQGGTLTLRTFHNKHIYIGIQDTGHGIPQEDISRIFEPFFTTRVKGIGLGLAIVKTIIEEHNGTITVRSKVGEGTLCVVKLPLSSGEQRE